MNPDEQPEADPWPLQTCTHRYPHIYEHACINTHTYPLCAHIYTVHTYKILNKDLVQT